MAKQKYRRSKRHSVASQPTETSGAGGAPSSAPASAGEASTPETPPSGVWQRLRQRWLPPSPRPRLFRRVDWWTFGGTAAITFLLYLITIAPDLTLEDCGELSVASYYAGVPHAPGYPIWTLYTWLFANLLPLANVAFRVAVSSAVAAALANGLLGMIVSRGSSMLIEGMPRLKDLDRRWEEALCLVSGTVAALLIGFNGFMWSQAVIVEVYTLSVLSLMGVLICLLHWTYDPERRRYLYLAAFLFGICFNNHQTLIVAAIGIEVLIAMVHPKLGRDAFFANSVLYVLGLIAAGMGVLTTLDQNRPLAVIYHAVGLGSIGACGWLVYQTKGVLSEWKTVLVALFLWLFGASFYLLLPLMSVTNPPMNWAYPRTFDGFLHAVSRGQYEQTNPTDLFNDPLRFGRQLWMYFKGAAEEFHLAFLFLAVVPFFFHRQFRRRERAWLIGNTAIYACLAFLLLILLNPTPDKQSQELTRVFFTASHVIIAMFAGFGLTLIGAMLLRHYREFREFALYGASVAAALALFWLAYEIQEAYGDPAAGMSGLGVLWRGFWSAVFHPWFTPPVFRILAATLVLVLTAAFVGMTLRYRETFPPKLLLGFFAAIPLFSLISHWPANEQRGHLFGFWFGHDMFAPPFDLYPPMTYNAILFGGTDPGRFCPTYMIFCESFIKPSRRRDPEFDRRDVYIITQNALADNTYLDYIRAHYNRSAQHDPPFLRDAVVYLSDLLLPQKERENKAMGHPFKRGTLSRLINSLTNITAPLDRLYLSFGAAVEKRRRERGVYPAKEIRTPSPRDLQSSFDEYMTDVQRRYLHDQQHPNDPPQLKPGEQLNVMPDGRVQVAGQVAVMAINAILTKDIFDANPTNEFYVEESFPLDWMYPHLTPYGIIMKINREPVKELTAEDLRRDHEFWTRFSERLCGNWVTPETPVRELCAWVEKVYRRGNLAGYTGDPKFVRDNDAQKSFAKLRNSIAGLYAWRIQHTTNATERARLIPEADFAYKQAFAFCPFSPETVSRYAQLLVLLNRVEDALLLTETALRFDTESIYLQQLRQQLRNHLQASSTLQKIENTLAPYEQAYRAAPTNFTAALNLVTAYAQLGRTNEAFQILDALVAQPNTQPAILLAVANTYMQLGQYGRTEKALRRLTTLMPNEPELWYDLAGAQVALGSNAVALKTLRRCFEVNARRRAADPTRTNLQALAASDPRFRPLRILPEFQRLLRETPPSPPAKP